jgi:histidinol-phosphatase (PHP family)
MVNFQKNILDLHKLIGQKTSMHTHTVFSDGDNTPEEMVEAAIGKGLSAIGISDHGHSSIPGNESYTMKADVFPAYAQRVRSLAGKFPIPVYLGLEVDSLSPVDTSQLDYFIGSVHDIYWDGGLILTVDWRDKFTECGIAFNGNERLLVKRYYRAIIEMLDLLKPDIVGHFDIVKKCNANNALFDEDEPWYRSYVLEALEAIRQSGKIMEVNTGGISRGYLTQTYPSPWIIKEMRRLDIPVIVTDDSHNVSTVAGAFEETYRMLREMGY